MVGDLVVLKTHPLLESYRIKGDGKLVPPILLIKEVYIENNKKVICEPETGKTIADKVKYICVYFNDSKSEFVESTLYESMLQSFRNLKIEKMSKVGEAFKDDGTIIEEIDSYKIPQYDYGKVVRLKTKKIEIYKKRSSRKFIFKDEEKRLPEVEKVIQYVVNYTSPDLILCGYKKNESKNSHYPNGNIKKMVSENLFKVKWFNSNQQKFSEEYLPEEFLTDEMNFSEIE